jgi:hypothetical protein
VAEIRQGLAEIAQIDALTAAVGMAAVAEQTDPLGLDGSELVERKGL